MRKVVLTESHGMKAWWMMNTGDESASKSTAVQSDENPQSDWVGKSVTHRRYVAVTDTHYGGGLVDGAFVVGLFADVATELCIRLDGDEGLFASCDDIQFVAPIRAGDVIEAEAILEGLGRRSRKLRFESRVVCRADPERGPSASRVLVEPLVVATGVGTVVVPLGSHEYDVDPRQPGVN